jgi:hypothetical protein
MIVEPLLSALLSTSENIHDLKTWPEPFSLIWEERKLYEIRKTDRRFSVGDVLRLREWVPESMSYTGRIIAADVTCVTRGGDFGLPPDLCVMGIRELGRQSLSLLSREKDDPPPPPPPQKQNEP